MAYWFEVIGKELQKSAIRPENVYNMDGTGVMLGMLNYVKVLVGKEEIRRYRGARITRTVVTAVECISADDRCLDPIIIWPASTNRANWSTHPTPGWVYGLSGSGFTDSYISLQWLKQVFDPQTKQQRLIVGRVCSSGMALAHTRCSKSWSSVYKTTLTYTTCPPTHPTSSSPVISQYLGCLWQPTAIRLNEWNEVE
jgi:hypothetical protein